MSDTDIGKVSRPFIHGYGDSRFRIGGDVHDGSVIVVSDKVIPWQVDAPGDVTLESLSAITSADPRPQILLVGCGDAFVAPPKDLRISLIEAGISLEWMDTGAACRTYNIVASDDRHAAAALIAVE